MCNWLISVERLFGFTVCTAPSTRFSGSFKMVSLFFLLFFFFTPSPLDPHDVNKIGIDGIQQFCDDLTLDPASISVLLIAWKFRAATQCEFSKQEFMDGMSRQGWEIVTHCLQKARKQYKSVYKSTVPQWCISLLWLASSWQVWQHREAESSAAKDGARVKGPWQI